MRTLTKLAIGSMLALVMSACETAPSNDGASTPTSTNPGTMAPPTPVSASVGADILPDQLYLCPMTSVSNAPGNVQSLKVSNYQKFVSVNGVEVALAPVEKACFSSGFGPRGSKTHKGVDLHNSGPVRVFAGAGGTVREQAYRDDYGNMLVIDHGAGVFTRYAHLESFAPGIETGALLSVGQTVGVMGNTASYRIPRHLHYELLTGQWGVQAGSFALTPVDAFALLP